MSMPEDPERLAQATPRSALGQLFDSASRDLPTEKQIARLATQLGPLLNEAPGTTSGAPGRFNPIKWGIGVGTAALIVGATLILHRPAQPVAVPAARTPKVADTGPRPPESSAVAPLAIAPATSAESAPSSPSIDKPRATDAKSSPHATPPSEAALLEQARRALNSSPSYALQLANQHRTRFPNGVLTQEREVIAIEALRRLHRQSEADQRASGFTKAFPGSAHQRMVDDAAPK